MNFDVAGARQAGYSEAEIADYLGRQRNFDVAGARQAGYSDAEILGHLGVIQPASQGSTMEPVPERGLFGTIGARAADVGGSVVSGAGSVATGLGGLGGVLGLTGYDNILTRLGRRGAEFGAELMSPELRNQRRALADAMKEAEERGLAAEAGAALSTLASNPGLLFSMAVEQIPAFILSGGVGRAATAVGQVGARGAARAGTVAAERAGQAGAIGTAASLQTGGIADETYREVMGLPEETIVNSPNYQQLLRSMSPSEARETIANRAAREAAALGGGVSVAAMTALPSAEKALFTRGISQSAVRRALGVGTAEAVSEGIEEGGGEFAQNLAIQRQADAERDLLRGVGGAAATGAVLGGVMGAGAGALQRAPLPPSTEPGAGNLTPELRQAIDEYVANREPMTEGQNLLPRELPVVDTPVGSLTVSQAIRYFERRFPELATLDDVQEKIRVGQTLLAQEQEARAAGRQDVEADRYRREIATSPETEEAFRLAEVQRQTGRRAEEVIGRVPLERETPYAAGRRAEAEQAFSDVKLQQRLGPVLSTDALQRDLANAEQQLGQLIDARRDAQDRLKSIEKAPVVDAVAREAVQAEIGQLTQLISGREQIRREIAARIPETERQVTARENLQAQAQGAFDIAQARRENLTRQQQAPGIEIPSGSGVPDTIPQQVDDTRAGAAQITGQRYLLNPVYNARGELEGGEQVLDILPSDNFGKVLAVVERRRGNITEEVPVETTMGELVQMPVRESARATQEAAGAAVGPEQVAGRRGRGVDPLGQNLQPRRMVDRQGPEASARVAGEAQAAPEAEVSEADVRSTKRIEAQNRINRLYLDKLKDFGAQGRLLRNALVQALKDRTMSAQEVYAAFTAADAFAPLLPAGANHRIEFVKELLPTDKLAEAIRRSGGDPTKPLQGLRQRPSSEGLPGVIKISLASEMLPMLGETVAHEAFHVLQDYYGKFDPQFKKLMDQGFRDGMSISDVDSTIRRKLEQARYPNSDRSYWQTLTGSIPGTLTAREAQAYAFGALADAARRGVPMAGLKPAFARFVNTIKNFFSKLGSKLRGDGFQTVEEVLGRVSRGEARRFDTMASPTARDIATPGPELSARTSSVELREKPPKVGGTGAGGSKITVKDIGEYFDQVNGRTDPNDPAAMQDAIDSALAEVNYQLSQQNTGEKWYEEDVADAFNATARIIPELNDVDHRRLFSAYAALLSNGTRAGANWENAAIGYREFLKTGQLPEQRPSNGKGWTGIRSGVTAQQIRMLNMLLKRPEFQSDPIGGLTNWLLTTHPVSEIQDFRNSTKIFSGDLASVGTRKDERMGAYILGPKFGPFMLNINGIKDTTTDSWFTRTFNRHFGRMTGPGAVGDAGLVDAPRNPAERRLMKDVFTATLAKETGKTDQAIQAILWYYEQQLFYAMGVKSARSESFSDGAKKFAGSQPGQARGARPEGAARSNAGRAAREGDREAAGAGAGPRPEQDEATAQVGLTEEQAEASARATNTTVPEFTNWWNGGWREGGPKKASVASKKDGSPMPYYHGTGGDQFSAFANATSGAIDSAEGPFFFSPEPSFTDDYTGYSDPATGASPFPGARVIPVFLSVQKPFDPTDPKRQAELIRFMNDLMLSGRVKPDDILFFSAAFPINQAIASGELTPKEGMAEAIDTWRRTLADPDISWKAIEKPIFQKYIRGNGFDSFYVIENGVKNLAVYNPRQIKSIFNKFEPGAATEPEFSARSPLAADPAFAAMRDKLTGKEIDKPNVFADGLRRFVGALPGENISSALVRTSVNRAGPGWMLDNLSKDKGMTVRNVGRAMEVALNNSGRVQMYLNHGPLAYDPKTGDVTVRDDVPGLIDAIKGKLNVADKREAQAYLVALRERDLRKTGKKGFFNLTDKEMNSIISKAESAHPEWKQMAADIQRINKALLDFAVNTGTLDRAKADQLGSMFYTPFYRQAEGDVKDDSDAVVGPRLSQSLTRVKTAFDVSVKGGENPLGDLFENMIRNADTIMKAGMKNVAMRQAAEALQDVGLGRPAKEREKGKTITYRVNGQDKHFEVDDATLYVALAGAPREFTNGIYKTMANMAAFFRDMVTLAPSFMLANLWRGKIMAYVQEGVPLYANTFDGLRQALRSSSSYKAIAAQTGFGGYTYGMGERDAAAAFEREIAGLGYGPGGLLRRTIDTLQKASEATEMAERIKLYERMKAQGMTDKEAAFQAYLLAPFSRRGMGDGWLGYTVNWLVPLVPFLNAKIQGMYRLIENEKGDTQKLWTLGLPKQMLLRGLVVMGLSVALAAKSMDEEPERWDNENPDLKFRYDIIYLPNDNRILLPRAFEVGSVFGAIPVFIIDAIRRNDSRDLSKALADLGTSTFFFNPIPQAAVPMLGAFTNYDFFRSRALETAGDASKLPEERINRSTSAVAKAIGETFGISPIRTQYVLEGYSGTIGSSVLAGFDSILAAFGMIPGKPAGAFGDPMSMPAIAAGLTGVNRFYRSDDQSASRFIGDFYKIKEMTDQLVRSQNMATETRDLDRLAELRGDAGLPLRLRPMVNQASTQITEINKRIARIERSDLDSVAKAEALRPLREQRDRVARRVVERARDIGAY